MLKRLRRWWAGAAWWRRGLAITGVVLLIAVAWIAQGVLSVLWQVDAYADHWDQRAQADGEIVYVALGDSAAQGVGASDPDRGYVGLLADRIEEATGQTVRVVNLGASGARAADVLEAQLPLLDDLDADVITLAVGGNDAGNTDPQDFRTSITTLLDALPAGTFVGDLPDFQGGPRLGASLTLSAIVRDELGSRPSLVAVPLEATTSANTWLDYAPDFFHPDDSGYERWAEAFWQRIQGRM
ncbi:hypothetical protein BH23ACT9_BH23ACT9_35380 [soil metagenome]